MSVLFTLLGGILAQSSGDSVQRWIRDLRAEHLAVREEATQRLLAIGNAARDALSAARRDADPDTSIRARYILERIEHRERLGAFLRSEFPDLEDALWRVAPGAWCDQLLRITAHAGANPRLEPKHVRTMLPDALAGAESPQRRWAICQSVKYWALREAAPWLATRLLDADRDVKLASLEALGRVGGKSEVDAVAACLSDGDSRVREWACCALLLMGGCGEASQRIFSLLHDPSAQVRYMALICSRDAGLPIADIGRLIDDSCPRVRKAALAELGERDVGADMGNEVSVRRSADDLRAWLEGRCWSGRAADAASLLASEAAPGTWYSSLNGALRPQVWKRFERVRIAACPRETRGSLLRRIAEAAGCALDVRDMEQEWLDSSELEVNVAFQECGATLLRWICERREFVVDEDTLRFIRSDDARQYWIRSAARR